MPLPLAGNVLHSLALDVKARQFAAFDPQILWNKPGKQAIVHAQTLLGEGSRNAIIGTCRPRTACPTGRAVRVWCRPGCG